MSRLLAVVIMGNWPASVSSCKRPTWASFFTWRQDSKNLAAKTIELVKGQIGDMCDIKDSYKAKPGAKGGEIDSTS